MSYAVLTCQQVTTNIRLHICSSMSLVIRHMSCRCQRQRLRSCLPLQAPELTSQLVCRWAVQLALAGSVPLAAGLSLEGISIFGGKEPSGPHCMVCCKVVSLLLWSAQHVCMVWPCMCC